MRLGGKFDKTVKRDGYFDLPRVHDYLSTGPKARRSLATAASRWDDPDVAVNEGTLALAPPGIELTVTELLTSASKQGLG
jgi:hypothetical protein